MGLPVDSQWAPMGVSWDSQWTPSGLPWESHGTPSGLPPFYYCKYGESQSSPSGLPWDSQCSNCGLPGTELELDWEWTWTPRLLVAQCNVLEDPETHSKGPRRKEEGVDGREGKGK